jgi:hypothetical protein
MGIDPESREGELGHVGSPDRNESRCAQARDGRRILRGRSRVAQHDRTGGRHLAGNIEQILDRDWDAGKGRRRRAMGTKVVVIVRRGQRARGIDLEEDAAALPG